MLEKSEFDLLSFLVRICENIAWFWMLDGKTGIYEASWMLVKEIRGC